MKRCIACMLVLLLIINSMILTALGEGESDGTDILFSVPERMYQTMIGMFNKTMSSDKLYVNPSETAVNDLKQLKRLAEQGMDYKDCSQWVTYIDGIIALLNKDYTGAQVLLAQLDSPNFNDNTEALLAYANGQLLEQQGNLIDAALAYKSASSFLTTDAEALYERLTNPQFIRSVLMEYLEDKQYDHVIAMIDQLEQNYIDVPQAAMYKGYVLGLIELENPEVKDEGARLDNALPYFEEGAKDKFLDSDAQAADIKARQTELNGRLQDAVIAYRAAQSKARDDEVAGEALRYADSRLDDCLAELYTEADARYNGKEYAAAKELFLFLGDFKDSASRVQAINDIPEHALSNMEIFRAEATLLSLQWEDVISGPYNVTVHPTGMRFPIQSVSTVQKMLKLDGLTPGTAYTIDVVGVDGVSNTLTASTQTAPAEPFSSQGYDVMDTLGKWLYQYNTADTYNYKLSYMLTQIVAINDETWSIQPLPGTLPLPAGPLSQTGTGFAVIHGLFNWNPSPDEMTWMVRAVLRVPGVGIIDDMKQYKVAKQKPDSETVDVFQPIYVDLNPLLNALYEQNGSWPIGDVKLDIYINDMLVITDTLNIVHAAQ
ncbi:hypothetical protein FACS1894184_05020 [Clostridia bacterium]|nr:hypothetical protein FACS1894184_05020 [Clostridia bacterium]